MQEIQDGLDQKVKITDDKMTIAEKIAKLSKDDYMLDDNE